MEKQDKENVGLMPIIVEYLRHWKFIVCSGIISLILGILYLVIYPKTYETMARIQVRENNDMMSTGSFGLGEAAGMMKSFGLGGLASKAGISIDDEISTLYSSTLMSDMVTQLGLYVEYKKPYIFWFSMYGEEPVQVTCDPGTLANLEESIKFKISVTANGDIQIITKTKNESHKFLFDSFPAVVDVKQGRFTITGNPASKETSFKINAEVSPPSWVAEMLSDEINIEDYSNTSNMIEFTFRDHQRQRAKDILNTLITLYNKDAYSYKKRIGDSSLDFLRGRIESVTTGLSDIEQKIEIYKTANQLTDVMFDIQYYAEYMRDLKIKIIEQEVQTTLIDELDAFIKKPENKYALIPAVFTSASDMEMGPVSLYNVTLLDRERMLKSATPENPSVINLNMQVDKLRESVFQMIESSNAAAMKIRKNLEEQEKQLISRRSSVPAQERVYVDYKRQQEIFQGVYLILLQKQEEIALSIGQDIEKAKLIDAAFIKKKPVQPRKIYAAIGIVLLTFIISVSRLFMKSIYLSMKEEFKRTS
ncbi:MAG: tyrosine protein kinase [Tannerella sp.]|jgi:uncharacterized protein involved in exopolysaccharide biosynthesis|nr:tyrosine protein kinase [Tannerella sp.]